MPTLPAKSITQADDYEVETFAFAFGTRSQPRTIFFQFGLLLGADPAVADDPFDAFTGDLYRFEIGLGDLRAVLQAAQAGGTVAAMGKEFTFAAGTLTSARLNTALNAINTAAEAWATELAGGIAAGGAIAKRIALNKSFNDGSVAVKKCAQQIVDLLVELGVVDPPRPVR